MNWTALEAHRTQSCDVEALFKKKKKKNHSVPPHCLISLHFSAFLPLHLKILILPRSLFMHPNFQKQVACWKCSRVSLTFSGLIDFTSYNRTDQKPSDALCVFSLQAVCRRVQLSSEEAEPLSDTKTWVQVQAGLWVYLHGAVTKIGFDQAWYRRFKL